MTMLDSLKSAIVDAGGWPVADDILLKRTLAELIELYEPNDIRFTWTGVEA